MDSENSGSGESNFEGRGIDYGFGSGESKLSSWTSSPSLDLSGDGRLDAVSLDFDGDGVADDAMWDSDGDGKADLAVLNVGNHPTVYSDTGRGLWDHRVHDVTVTAGSSHNSGAAHNSDGQHDADQHEATPYPSDAGHHLVPEPTHDEQPGATSDEVSLTQQGPEQVDDFSMQQRPGVGLVFAAGERSTPSTLLVDLDGDNEYDAAVLDTNADGIADAWATRGDDRFTDAMSNVADHTSSAAR